MAADSNAPPAILAGMVAYSKILHLKRLQRLRLLHADYGDPIQVNQMPTGRQLPDDLNHLRDLCITCHLCGLSKTRKNVVFGEGNPNANIMFIGECPGAVEDETGRPFVGRAGELLTRIIENVLGFQRQDVFIANIVKCRPPQNRVPSPSEALTCRPYLFRQIQLIDPKIIVSLGNTSYHYLTEDKASISRVRGQTFQFGTKTLVPTFHPSFLLRNPSAKKEAYADFLKIKSLL